MYHLHTLYCYRSVQFIKHISYSLLSPDPHNNTGSYVRCFVFIAVLQDEETEAHRSELTFRSSSKLGLETIAKPSFYDTHSKVIFHHITLQIATLKQRVLKRGTCEIIFTLFQSSL